MRSVLIAIDFVKDVDNSFKVLELNTGIVAAPISIEPYFNKVDFDNFITENNINEIELILLSTGPVKAINPDYPNDTLFGFGRYFDVHYSGLTITKQVVELENQVTPNTVDSPNKLIIRQSYDPTALIDETYAKDNFEFLKLLYDSSPTAIAKTYINHESLGFDMIGDTVRNNGNLPNYIIKQRFPTTNYSEYPKVYKIDTQEQLSNLKTNLPPNTLLQEYVINTNDLENGKLKTYRSVGLICGPELNIINLIDPFIHTNTCSIDLTVDVDSNLEIQPWERPKYLQKYQKKSLGIEYNSDSTNLIIKNDGSLVSPSQLEIGDSLMSINLYGLDDVDTAAYVSQYTGNTEDVFSGSTISATTIQSISTKNENVWLRNIVLDNGLKFSDIDESKLLIKRDGVLKFKSFYQITNTDEIVIVNKNNNLFETRGIVSNFYTFSNENIYSIDVEDIDLYLTMDESTETPEFFIIQHNAPRCLCWYFSGFPNYWQCAEPCLGFSGLYTGGDMDNCMSLGLPPFYCTELVCCVVQPESDVGVIFGGECPDCRVQK
jgi:hypothetical protein